MQSEDGLICTHKHRQNQHPYSNTGLLDDATRTIWTTTETGPFEASTEAGSLQG
jgi:hypothetical protein